MSDAGRADGAPLESRTIVSVRVDATSYERACRQIAQWAHNRESRYVCACNVHMVMEAHDDATFAAVVNQADLVTADGMPLVWALRALGVRRPSRVYGPDLMLALCRVAEEQAIPVGLYGSTELVRKNVETRLLQRYPELIMAYSHSPNFGATLSDGLEVHRMRAAGVGILFVALGCPKQERWMADHRETLPAVMVGVGAAFDFISGHKPQAPALLQRLGLEWLFRSASEPRRLWRRYAIHNPRFIALLARQLVDRRSRADNSLARPR